jgi:glucose-6-phosphate isomerase
VLHVALRAGEDAVIRSMARTCCPRSAASAPRMRGLCPRCAVGRFTGQGGRITDVVNIGIGGSDLGPAMAYAGAGALSRRAALHFVSNVDGAHIA